MVNMICHQFAWSSVADAAPNLPTYDQGALLESRRGLDIATYSWAVLVIPGAPWRQARQAGSQSERVRWRGTKAEKEQASTDALPDRKAKAKRPGGDDQRVIGRSQRG